jgi:hypothetical protein
VLRGKKRALSGREEDPRRRIMVEDAVCVECVALEKCTDPGPGWAKADLSPGALRTLMVGDPVYIYTTEASPLTPRRRASHDPPCVALSPPPPPNHTDMCPHRPLGIPKPGLTGPDFTLPTHYMEPHTQIQTNTTILSPETQPHEPGTRNAQPHKIGPPWPTPHPCALTHTQHGVP